MNEANTEPGEAYYQTYADYARILRHWFVAYGIGAPLLFATNTMLAGRVARSGEMRLMVYLFLAGVVLQIFVTTLNKWVNWYMHWGDDNPERQQRLPHRIAFWFHDKFWIDIGCDVGTATAFVTATWLALTAVL